MFGLIMMLMPLVAVDNINFSYEDLVQMNRGDSYGVDFNASFSTINAEEVKSENGDFADISINGYTHTNQIGAPRLPMLRKIISAPLGAQVKAYATSYDLTDFNLADFGMNRIYPAQESVEKCQDAVVNFAFDSAAYSQKGFTTNPIVSVEELGMMRGERLFAVNFYPVQLDASANVLRVYNDVNIQVEFLGGDLFATQQLKAKTFSPAFEASLAKKVMNYSPVNTRDTLTRHPMGYLIISDPMFEAQLEPFVTWKTEEGYNVTVAYTDDIGTSTTSIKNYIQGIWDAATAENPAPTYLLICGDIAEVPAYGGSTDSGHVTDLNYVRLEGADYVPEMYYGRFSASNTTDFQPQIDKTLEYEKYEMPDPSYLGEVIMIAGVDGNFAPTHGNGQITYGTDYYFNEAHGIESHTYLYPASGSSASSIIQNLNDGVGYANYTAHGYNQEWSNPNIDNADLANLTNEHMYPVVVGNCCLTNHFDTGTCFGEQWLRLADKGAVGYIGGTNSTYWDEDFWWGVGSGSIVVGSTYETHGLGVYDGLFRDGANEVDDYSRWYTTTGQMIFNGNLAVTEGGSSRVNYYWEIYSVMGDPSLNVYLGVPEENNATLPATFFIGVNSVQISADPYSYVAISMDGVLHGTAMVDATGSIDMDFAPFTGPGTARVVITAPNTEPLIASIDVIPNDGPYVALGGVELSDDNDNMPAFGETMNVDVTLDNVGSDPASAVVATLTSTDSYVTLVTDEATYGDIAAGGSITTEDAFSFTLANNVPDQYIVPFTVTSTATEAEWESTFNVIVNAPVFELGSMIINDAAGNNDGLLDAGETATITIPISNIGHATSEAINAVLTSANPELLIVNTASVDVAAIAADGTATAAFEVTIADDAAVGSFATLGFSLTSGAYTASGSFVPSIGLVFEDFETGDFSKFDWINDAPGWMISSDVQEGTYSAQSNDISHNQDASLSIEMEVATDGEITFYKKVSSENNYDYLRFFINGSEAASWCGDVAWSQETFDVSAGSVTFEWKYTKDGSVDGGSDCGWIDYIVFPGGGGAAGGNPIATISTTEIAFDDVVIDETETEEFTISNLGAGELTGTIAAPAGFTLSNDSFTVAAGGSVAIEVTFAPTAIEAYEGDIVISSNDPNNAELTVAVTGNGTDGSDSDNPMIPAVTSLQGNYPNPFNPTTNIKFGLKEESKVKLEIYNIRGQKIQTLVNESREAGYHTVTWEGNDSSSKTAASGIYFFRLTTDKYSSTKKMILMK